jgi:putative modified peptide
MADSTLTKEQGLALLTKLATDDAFRGHFEQKPAHALHDLGVPGDVIARLPARCLCPRKLAPKAEMDEARKKLSGDVDMSTVQFLIPTAKL